jgi:hypothetical protein
LTEELSVLFEVVRKLESAGAAYMLTGSMAMNLHAVPRMTRDIDLVVTVTDSLLDQLPSIFPPEHYYLSEDAARDAVAHSSCFNLVHLGTMMKIDIMVRKSDEYRIHEFSRKQLHQIEGQPLFVVSKEDLILSKLDWARESGSERQLADVQNLLATSHDPKYLQQWATKLHLTDILTRVSA